ncbi:hypothetical protein BGZ70_007662 [Mortierella alpina]|uniref:Alginate lyase domain-containing protein n=1 Tax=Mortierella alpina TaxID=64518 RepID=A0A9P6M6S3_MORAP|nr:hypothetical protein BGZ70_007662 [Mortierella alpina]
MKKARPNSVSVLPSHHSQFKDKPLLGSDGSPLVGVASGVAGRWTLRRVILAAGGLLFCYITLTTLFGAGPEHNRRAPSAIRPESDPYRDVPKDNRYGGQMEKPVPEIKFGNEVIDKDSVVKKDPWNAPEEVPADENELARATRARKNSPVTYPELLSANRRERDYAIALIVREADLALKSTEVYSVTNKKQTAPSNDIHDYLSLSKYYWPNPKSEDGLPYIRRDGHVNPEIETVKDYRLLRTMIREVHMMGMAYHFTGKKAYADKCAMRLKEWFLDEATYMNPNINFGSLQKGKKLGARTGVLDMFTIFRVFDALHYLKQEPSWPEDLIPQLQAWFTRYVKWLDSSVLAKVEREGNNNHGTYYDVQVIGLYLFLGRVDDARAVAQTAVTNRIDRQITAAGEQPEETERQTSWYYSVFNLQAMMTLARWGDDLGVDMWFHEGPQGQSIKKAIDYMLPYSLTGGEGWPHKNIKGFPMVDYLKCLQIAWNIYGDQKYLDAITHLEPLIQKEMDVGNLKTISTFMCDISTLLEAGKRGGQGLIWHWCLT